MPRFVLPTIAVACAIGTFVLGLWLGGHPADLPSGVRSAFVDPNRALQAEVMRRIESSYYRKIPQRQLEQASLTGMVQSLGDPFSHYFGPAQTKLFQESLQNQFEGVGVTVKPDRRGLRVLKAFPGSPAAKAGIGAGDVITRVNGESIAGQPSDLASAKIRGRPGTSVRLTVLAPRGGRERELTVPRARIDLPIVTGELHDQGGVKLGVARLTTFSDGSHGLLRRKVDQELGAGAKGLVLDLRGNGGGVLQEAVLVSSIFVERGRIVSTRGRASPDHVYDAQGGAIDPKIPVVVLVDGGTASSSEITTGALRDHGRAVVIGEKTFGKGVFQQVFEVSGGGVLDITVGKYFLPNGENIGHTGITPQIPARDDPRTPRDEALPVALKTLRAKVR